MLCTLSRWSVGERRPSYWGREAGMSRSGIAPVRPSRSRSASRLVALDALQEDRARDSSMGTTWGAGKKGPSGLPATTEGKGSRRASAGVAGEKVQGRPVRKCRIGSYEREKWGWVACGSSLPFFTSVAGWKEEDKWTAGIEENKREAVFVKWLVRLFFRIGGSTLWWIWYWFSIVDVFLYINLVKLRRCWCLTKFKYLIFWDGASIIILSLFMGSFFYGSLWVVILLVGSIDLRSF
jgi:hypothetical protein